MTHEERMHALASFGFTPRQASFLALVMLHAGVCLGRHYCTHARIVRGQKSHDFFRTLVGQGFATASHTEHHGTRLYHLHGKRLYRAIGEPDSRHRRPVTLARAIERLMVLDGILPEPETSWLATPQEKVEHFSKATVLPVEQLPGRGIGDREGPRRPFPDPWPIGRPRGDQPHVFLYLVTNPNPLDFRGFLHRHAPLLRALNRWEIRLLVSARLETSVRRFESAAIEELASPLSPSEPADMNWYFDQQRLVKTGRPSDDPTRFAALRRAFAMQRYWALYRIWKERGDGALYDATSPMLSTAMDVEDGRVTCHVLPHDYLRLTSLVGTA